MDQNTKQTLIDLLNHEIEAASRHHKEYMIFNGFANPHTDGIVTGLLAARSILVGYDIHSQQTSKKKVVELREWSVDDDHNESNSIEYNKIAIAEAIKKANELGLEGKRLSNISYSSKDISFIYSTTLHSFKAVVENVSGQNTARGGEAIG